MNRIEQAADPRDPVLDSQAPKNDLQKNDKGSAGHTENFEHANGLHQSSPREHLRDLDFRVSVKEVVSTTTSASRTAEIKAGVLRAAAHTR